MYGWLWLEPVIPFATSAALLIAGRRMGRRAAGWIGTGAIAASTIIAALLTWQFIVHPPSGGAYTQVLWQWFAVAGFHPRISLYLDSLAVVMTLVVSFVSFLIHLYSAEFMAESEGYERFFAYMNLFVASMLTLVLASNLLLLFLGWEGVGLCSYLLIGFWYDDEVNGLAGRKAFIVTRAGDVAMTLGLVLLVTRLGTLDIQELMHRVTLQWHYGAMVAEVAGFLLLGGAVGKSAQFPLQTWLPDAMAGPTPTSALIHAATMVTAGVYLIARLHVLYALAPMAQLAVALAGFITLVIAGFSALTQHDIKRILAYSTISQIGYMFLALGVGAWSAAIFHLVTHAFFKALLFLASGVVIQALHEEHDIFKMGGLRKRLPLAFWCFIFAGSSLAGLPLITAGFYSKGVIMWSAHSSAQGAWWLWAGAMAGAFMTALYTFRLIFVVFYGEPRQAHPPITRYPGPAINWPLGVLGFLSMLAGFIDLPAAMGGREALSGFLTPALPRFLALRPGMGEISSELLASILFFAGVYLIYLFQLQKPGWSAQLAGPGLGDTAHRFWFADWGMDWLYEKTLVHPVAWFARVNKADGVDRIYDGIAWLSEYFHRGLSRTENGRLRWYAGWVTAGAIVLVALAKW
ncbi:MAG TPA: NADH-quinone oxidoreductase subunit L [Terriglobales bacterium]|jgi:NADH-quinone oxidoreductase subunit L